LSWPRWKLKHLAIAIAVLAVAFAFLGVEGTALGFILCLPAIFAPAGRRLTALYWVSLCYPVLVLSSLHVTWFVAWAALGHPPRPSLDDPKDINQILIPYVVTGILLVGSPIALIAATGLSVIRVIQGPKGKAGGVRLASLLVNAPTSWVAGWLLLIWDPLDILNWYLD
jgi:hypothetical protein